MANKNGREALRGVEASVLDLIAQVLTSEQWEELLKAPLERAAFLGDRQLAQRLIQAGAEMGDALHKAVGGGHGDIVDDLLEKGASVATKDPEGYTPLHVAAKKGETELVQLLLRKGADIDTVNSSDGLTPLLTAVSFEHTAAALALLAAGADVGLRCWTGFERPMLHMALEKGLGVDILRAAIEQGADVNDNDRYSITPLHVAARYNNSEAIDVLMEAGADIAAQDSHGSTPLHRAAEQLNPVAVTALLKHGADVNASNAADYETPLHIAAAKAGKHGAAEVVDLLLRSGADESIVDEDGNVAADVMGPGVLQERWLAGEVERVRKLLANAPVDRAWRRRGYLMLCRANPGKVQLGRDSDNTHTALAFRSPTGAGMEGIQVSGCSGIVGRNTAAVDERTDGGNWAGVVAKLLGVQEEVLFRTIVGYL